MKLPRDLSGRDLAAVLVKLGYHVTRQTGSHMRLTTEVVGEHQVTIPDHNSLKVGTLSTILREVTEHAGANTSHRLVFSHSSGSVQSAASSHRAVANVGKERSPRP